MKKISKSDKEIAQESAMKFLRKSLKVGATVYTIVTHVSKSGMSRDIKVMISKKNELIDIEAKKFLRALWLNNEEFHPEDSAHEILWRLPDEQNPTFKECDQLDKLISDIYALEGNKDKYPDLAFDPCQYLLDLDLKTYSIAEAKAIWHESLNENNPTNEDFSYFIERMMCDNEEFTQWALKATEPEIIERFIELYYPL